MNWNYSLKDKIRLQESLLFYFHWKGSSLFPVAGSVHVIQYQHITDINWYKIKWHAELVDQCYCGVSKDCEGKYTWFVFHRIILIIFRCKGQQAHKEIEDVFLKRSWGGAEVSPPPVGRDVMMSMYQDGSIFLRWMHSSYTTTRSSASNLVRNYDFASDLSDLPLLWHLTSH